MCLLGDRISNDAIRQLECCRRGVCKANVGLYLSWLADFRDDLAPLMYSDRLMMRSHFAHHRSKTPEAD